MDINEILNQLDELFKHQLIKQVEPFLLQHIKQSIDMQLPTITLSLYNELMGYYRSISKHQKALNTASLALNLIQKLDLKDDLATATTLLNIATVKRASNNPKEALCNYQKVLEIYHHLDVSSLLKASLYNNMSLAFSELNDYSNAKKFLNSALTLIQNEPNQQMELASTYNNLANLELQFNHHQEAKSYIKQSIAIYETLTPIPAHYGYALMTLGLLYLNEKDYSKALEIYTLALKHILTHYGENEAFINICQNCATILDELGYQKEATQFNQRAIRTSLKLQTDQMSGLEISRAYYQAYKQQLFKDFKEYQNRVAIGLVGQGSECFGFDDAYSRDHDFGPSFCVFLNDEDYLKIGDKLQHAYEQLPNHFLNLPPRNTTPQGKNRVGVIKTSDFYQQFIGSKNGELSNDEWLHIPSYYLATVTNGEVFEDPLGEFSNIRQKLLQGYPQDIKYKKIAARLAYISQSGQYNFARSMFRQDTVAASLALSSFISNTIELIYLINNRYCPYYKWAFKGLKNLDQLSQLSIPIEKLTKLPLDASSYQNKDPHQLNFDDPHIGLIEEICKEIVKFLIQNKWTNHFDNYLETHIEQILNLIQNETIKNKHIMEG